jgi:glycosyltransferase involved in cell wall biosynthesis
LITLIKGFAHAKKASESLVLKIAGTGGMEDEIREFLNRENLSNIELLGFKQGKELEELTKNAKAIVIPSEWYENYPFSCLEAMAYGKPVIASDIGGIPEQIDDGISGFLFEPFSYLHLAEKIEKLQHQNKKEILEMGKAARAKVERINNPLSYISKIIPLYEALNQKAKKKIL